MNNVSLDETLFYQYMINNNSTSTMLNAINGNSSDDMGGSLTSVLNTMNSVNNYSQNNIGTGSISDIATILGLGNNAYSGIGSLDSFSGILQSYLNQNISQATEMAEKLEEVLEETAGTEEEGTKSRQTVQELYEYFSKMTSGQADSLLGILSPSKASEQEKSQTGSGMESMNPSMVDFESFEQETDEMIDSLMEETEIQY